MDLLEELRKMAREEMTKPIMNNLDSALIFTYIQNLEQENKKLKEDIEKYKIRLTDEQYNKIIDSCIADINHEWEDKIRNKIIEYKENIEIFKKIGKTDGIGITECKILGLEEILGEDKKDE